MFLFCFVSLFLTSAYHEATNLNPFEERHRKLIIWLSVNLILSRERISLPLQEQNKTLTMSVRKKDGPKVIKLKGHKKLVSNHLILVIRKLK